MTNATVEDVTVESFTTQNLFFMAPNAATKRPSRDITVRNLRCNVRQPKPTRTRLTVFVCVEPRCCVLRMLTQALGIMSERPNPTQPDATYHGRTDTG